MPRNVSEWRADRHAIRSAGQLAEESFLAADCIRQLMSVGEVDLLVGIPSYNNASISEQTLHSVEESLRQNFVRERALILTQTLLDAVQSLLDCRSVVES